MSGAMRMAITEAADMYKIAPDALLGRNRTRKFAHARQEIMTACYRALDVSLPQVGAAFNRDHTTVMHAIRQVEKREASDLKTANRLHDLQLMVRNVQAPNYVRGGQVAFKSVRAST